MKKLVFAIALVCLAACQKNNEPGTVQGLEVSAVVDDNVKTILGGQDYHEVLWEATDQVRGDMQGKSNLTFKVMSGAGTSAAKLYTNDAVTAEPTWFVMAFPKSTVDSYSSSKYYFNLPRTQTYRAGGFDQNANPMVAKVSNGSAVFKNTCGILQFKITADEAATIKSIKLTANDGKKISGMGYVGMGGVGNPIVMNSDDTAFSDLTIDCGEGVAVGSEAVKFQFVLPKATYTDLTIVITDAAGLTMTSNYKKSLAIARSQISATTLKYKPNGATECIDLSKNGNANSYIVSEAGNYKFKAVTPEGDALTDAVSAHWLWAIGEGWTDDSHTDASSLISNVVYNASSSEISFTAKASKGNVSIALVNSSKRILWSWHIWLTDAPSLVSETDGKTTIQVMDRNLGATSATVGAASALGLLYQWDRKDPFPGPYGIGMCAQWTPETVAESSAFKEYATYNDQGLGYTEFNVINTEIGTPWAAWISGDFPLDAQGNMVKFIDKTHLEWAGAPTTTNHRLSYHPANTETAWAAVANPCPAGYHVMTKGEALIITGVSTTQITPSVNEVEDVNSLKDNTKLGYNFIKGGNAIWMPAAGYRETAAGLQSCLKFCGHYARYCIADQRSGGAFNLKFTPNAMKVENASNSSMYGASVRCVKN